MSNLANGRVDLKLKNLCKQTTNAKKNFCLV